MNTKKQFLIGIACCLLVTAMWGIGHWISSGPAYSDVPQTAGRPLPANSSAFFSPEKLAGSGSSEFKEAKASEMVVNSETPKGPAAVGKQDNLSARFQVKGKDYVLGTDSFGAFPRISVEANQKIPIHLQYARGKADPEEIVTIQTLDGGGMEKNGKLVIQTKLTQQLSTDINFITGTQEGIYRVAVTQRGEKKVLQFWVGPAPAMKPVAQAK